MRTVIYWDHSFLVSWAAWLEPTKNKQRTFTSSSWLFTSRRWQWRYMEDNSVRVSSVWSECIREIHMIIVMWISLIHSLQTTTISKACRRSSKILGLFAHSFEKYLACGGIHVSFSCFDPFFSFRMYYPFFEMYTNFIETSNYVKNSECFVTSFLIFCHRLRSER